MGMCGGSVILLGSESGAGGRGGKGDGEEEGECVGILEGVVNPRSTHTFLSSLPQYKVLERESEERAREVREWFQAQVEGSACHVSISSALSLAGIKM